MTNYTRTELIHCLRALPVPSWSQLRRIDSVEFEDALEARRYASIYFNSVANQLMGGDRLPSGYDSPALTIEQVEPYFAQMGVIRAHLSRFHGTVFSLSAPYNDGGWVLVSAVCTALPDNGQGTGSVPLVLSTDLLWVQLAPAWRAA